jgi:hypothetical protein
LVSCGSRPPKPTSEVVEVATPLLAEHVHERPGQQAGHQARPRPRRGALGMRPRTFHFPHASRGVGALGSVRRTRITGHLVGVVDHASAA